MKKTRKKLKQPKLQTMRHLNIGTKTNHPKDTHITGILLPEVNLYLVNVVFSTRSYFVTYNKCKRISSEGQFVHFHVESRWVPPEGYIPRSERNQFAESSETVQGTEKTEVNRENNDEQVEIIDGDSEQKLQPENSEEKLEESRGTKRKLVGLFRLFTMMKI